jgi:hypothetical protein
MAKKGKIKEIENKQVNEGDQTYIPKSSDDYKLPVRKTLSIKGTVREFRVTGYRRKTKDGNWVDAPSPVDKILNVYARKRWDYEPAPSYAIPAHKDPIRKGEEGANPKTAVWKLFEEGVTQLEPVKQKAKTRRRKGKKRDKNPFVKYSLI